MVGKRWPTELMITVTGGLGPNVDKIMRINSAPTNSTSTTILDFLQSENVLLSVRIPHRACIV